MVHPSARDLRLPVAAFLAFAGLSACGGLQLKKVESAEAKPANVYVLFRAATGRVDPVMGK